MRFVIQKRRRGDDPADLVSTYVLVVEMTQTEADAVTNNTERAARWRELQDAIEAWEASP